MTSESPDFSVIVTCYFEEQSIDDFYQRLSKTLNSLGRSYEIVMVNDGSSDGTWARLLEIYRRDPNVTTVIDLFRNAGQTAAMTAGLTHAKGKAFVFIDSDLQLDPEDLPLLVAEFDKGNDIVSGYRGDRRDSLFRRLASKVANRVMRSVAGHGLSDYGCTFKIYDAKLVRAFEFGPFKIWSTGYVFSRARTCTEVEVDHHERRYGKSGWSVRKLVAFWMDHLVGVSDRPFQIISLVSLGLAAVFFTRIALAWLVDFSILPSVTPGMLLNAILLSFLVLLAVLALIGEYVIRNFLTLRRYPAYVIREIHQGGGE